MAVHPILCMEKIKVWVRVRFGFNLFSESVKIIAAYGMKFV